jgi:hypothetical protein
MSPQEFRARWRELSREERRFVRVVAALGETAGSDAGNELVAAYAADRLTRFRLAAQGLVAAVWAAYLVATMTLLRDVPTTALGAIAVLCAGAQAAWVLRAEGRLHDVIAVNRSA